MRTIVLVLGCGLLGVTGCAWLRPPEPTGYGGPGPYDRSAYETDKGQEAQSFGAPEMPRKSELLRGLR